MLLAKSYKVPKSQVFLTEISMGEKEALMKKGPSMEYSSFILTSFSSPIFLALIILTNPFIYSKFVFSIIFRNPIIISESAMEDD